MYTFVLLCQFFFSALSFRDTNNDHEDENDDSDITAEMTLKMMMTLIGG